ncbi:mannose-6-phosphate isomerase [Micromonospora polyrhachis]|uniref:mannose-6-phosphate isomerase n=2 Tax=Micromonospora polyrhachis TaxID=1282883 RepID=A0A7W7SNN6_9ACTN|nr:mannose-6-phosphate isomerase [Micromonospora polyrhachis]
MSGPIRDYAWGSRSAIAELQGRPVPSPGPEAELWLGAHPAASATVERDAVPVSLAELLAAEPRRWLGDDVVGRFGARLPFLLKVLAAETPLSLQAHPNAEQARAGYAAEQARSETASAPATVRRNYVDPYHKPEMLVALSPFEALCGFRDPKVSADVLAAFEVADLDPVVAALRTGPAGLAAAVQQLLTWPAGDQAGLLAAVLTAEVTQDFAAPAALARRLADRYPGDPGVLVALLLNHVTLAPGEAIWMPAGNLHAYLHGAGVELMAASDNVLRGGLTPKPVDVPELLRVLRFEVLDDPVLTPVEVAPGVVTWPLPVDDFVLHVVRLDAATPRVELALPGPRVVWCRSGRIEARDGTGATVVEPGRAAFGAADDAPLTLAGVGEAFVASVGTATR